MDDLLRAQWQHLRTWLDEEAVLDRADVPTGLDAWTVGDLVVHLGLGLRLVTGIEPKDGMSYEDFIDHWHHEHRRCAVETQSTFAYVRNEIVRALTPGAPPFAAIVEEHFPIEALTDPMVWYAAQGSKERFERNLKWMIESCAAFLAMDRVDSHPMSEYVFER